MAMTDPVTESVFSLRLQGSLFILKLQALTVNMKLILSIAVTEPLSELALGKNSGLYLKCQQQSLRLDLFLVNLQSFTKNRNDGACCKFCDRICF